MTAKSKKNTHKQQCIYLLPRYLYAGGEEYKYHPAAGKTHGALSISLPALSTTPTTD